ncbi:MAG: hypothetical protein AB1345_10955 [Chloroflexota bacterium]
MKQDRYLLAILVAIGLLVIASLVLFFIHKDKQAYLPDDTPEGVVHNYALALHQRDFERAYGYLVDKEHKPTLDQFRSAFISRQLDVSSTGLAINNVETMDGEAWVEVSVIYSPSGPFEEIRRYIENAILVEQEGAWRLSQMPYPYWGWDWYQPDSKPLSIP